MPHGLASMHVRSAPSSQSIPDKECKITPGIHAHFRANATDCAIGLPAVTLGSSKQVTIRSDGSEWWNLGGTVAYATETACTSQLAYGGTRRVTFARNRTVPDGEVTFTGVSTFVEALPAFTGSPINSDPV